MELLSFADLTAAEEDAIGVLLGGVTIVELTPQVRMIAICLRREHRLKLPDAIVAATAVELDTELLTNDIRLAGTPRVRVRALRVT